MPHGGGELHGGTTTTRRAGPAACLLTWQPPPPPLLRSASLVVLPPPPPPRSPSRLMSPSLPGTAPLPRTSDHSPLPYFHSSAGVSSPGMVPGIDGPPPPPPPPSSLPLYSPSSSPFPSLCAGNGTLCWKWHAPATRQQARRSTRRGKAPHTPICGAGGGMRVGSGVGGGRGGFSLVAYSNFGAVYYTMCAHLVGDIGIIRLLAIVGMCWVWWVE